MGDESPRWRNQVKESVRLFREQRTVADDFIPVEQPEIVAPSDSPNPVIEAALKRLQRTPRASAAQPKESIEPEVVRERPIVKPPIERPLLFAETTEVEDLPDQVPVQPVKRATREPRVVTPAAAVTPKLELHPPLMPAASSLPQPANLRIVCWPHF